MNKTRLIEKLWLIKISIIKSDADTIWIKSSKYVETVCGALDRILIELGVDPEELEKDYQ